MSSLRIQVDERQNKNGIDGLHAFEEKTGHFRQRGPRNVTSVDELTIRVMRWNRLKEEDKANGGVGGRMGGDENAFLGWAWQ